MLDFFTAEITSLGLLRQQAQAPHYFLRCLLISSEMKEVPHYFFRKKWGTSLFLQKKWSASSFLQKKMRHLFLQKKMKFHIISTEKMRHIIISKKKLLIISSEKNEMPHYFFRKKWSASSFLQEWILIFFGWNNEVLHLFWWSNEEHLVFPKK